MVLCGVILTLPLSLSPLSLSPQTEDGTGDVAHRFPDKLTRRFDVRLVPESTRKAVSLREIKAGHIGALTVTQGIVTRISDVRPMLTVATYVP